MTTVSGEVLEGVSATTLWTLRNRASEAKRSDGVIRDPWAVTLFDAISYDYLKFGKPNQSHALRAQAFDTVAHAYLAAHPKASVVALAEGLQTSFWPAGPYRSGRRIDLVLSRFPTCHGTTRETAAARRSDRAVGPVGVGP